MANLGLQERWQAHLDEQQTQRASEEEKRILRERRDGMLIHAKEVLERTGSENIGLPDDVYHRRGTPILPFGTHLGDLPGRGQTYAFGRLIIYYDMQIIEKAVKGRFFKRIETERVPTDTINYVGIELFAGDRTGANLESFAESHWSITMRDDIDPGMLSDLEINLSLIENSLTS